MVDSKEDLSTDKCSQHDTRVQDMDESLDSFKSPMHSTHRPLTRSQTGCVLKRPLCNETSLEATKKSGRAPKKTRDLYASLAEPSIASEESAKRVNQWTLQEDTTRIPAGSGSSSGTMTMTTLGCTTPDSSLPAEARRRTTLPIPVPNLTKRSRGRRVPTRLPNEDSTTGSSDTRTYVCKVETCGKCFYRGEHLKRHIRSIHTHEKPFKCTHPLCNKNFNRHDNLLQHLKVHKDLNCTDDAGSPIQLWEGKSPLSVTISAQLQPYYPAHDETFDASTPQDRYLPPISSIREDAPLDVPLSEPGRFATNMAVSSMRTEVSHSPRIRGV